MAGHLPSGGPLSGACGPRSKAWATPRQKAGRKQAVARPEVPLGLVGPGGAWRGLEGQELGGSEQSWAPSVRCFVNKRKGPLSLPRPGLTLDRSTPSAL